MAPKTIWGAALNGRDYCDKRSLTMTETEPPEEGTWHHHTAIHGSGSDDPRSEISLQTEEEWKARRLAWLDQFDLVISEEPEAGYRVWRWLGDASDAPSAYNGRSVRFSERRPWSARQPTTPGLWPKDA